MIKTDWDTYYQKTNKVTSITRKISEAILLELIDKYVKKESITIAEIGGANSCFYPVFKKVLKPSNYIVIDNNELGLKMFKNNYSNNVEVYNEDVLEMNIDKKVDLVFSVGLVEHFDTGGTKKAIQNHFKLIDKGDICLITFPTPTLLYRFARKVLELAGLWIFTDERPLKIKEVLDTMKVLGDILEVKMNWKIILTQGIIVAKKI